MGRRQQGDRRAMGRHKAVPALAGQSQKRQKMLFFNFATPVTFKSPNLATLSYDFGASTFRLCNCLTSGLVNSTLNFSLFAFSFSDLLAIFFTVRSFDKPCNVVLTVKPLLHSINCSMIGLFGLLLDIRSFHTLCFNSLLSYCLTCHHCSYMLTFQTLDF